jgi:hypothetical protein
MKQQEIILDILGLLLIATSVYFFHVGKLTFNEGTIIGVCGLALFVLKGSNIRKYIEKVLDKYLMK